MVPSHSAPSALGIPFGNPIITFRNIVNLLLKVLFKEFLKGHCDTVAEKKDSWRR